MIDTISRHRPLALLAGVVLAQVLLLAFQIKREHDVRLIRYWAVEMVTPIERAGTWSFSKVTGVWTGYVALHDTRAENERLRKEVQQLRLHSRELESKAAEAQRLATLLNFREAHPESSMLAAQVIGASADPTSHTLFINRGERDHIRRNLGVITPDGVVGKIVEVFPNAAQVLLINDKESGVGALFAESRTHGVVKGNGDPDPRMEYVENKETVKAGETILTSGEDRIFPKDLPIGIVASADQGNPFQVIVVHPAARLDRLEEVLVLLSTAELSPKKTEEASGATRSAPSAASAKTPAPSQGRTATTNPPKPAAPKTKPAVPATTKPVDPVVKPPAEAPPAPVPQT
ncbi:MAG: rod shape-determining protein MreC [Candidatus Acidiferrales bacterium]